MGTFVLSLAMAAIGLALIVQASERQRERRDLAGLLLGRAVRRRRRGRWLRARVPGGIAAR